MADTSNVARDIKAIKETLRKLETALGTAMGAGAAAPLLATADRGDGGDAGTGPTGGDGSSPGRRAIVYVHGICEHVAGFSNPWWDALHPFTGVFGNGDLNDTRFEVVWSDVIRQHQLNRGAAMGNVGDVARDAVDRIELAAQVRGVIAERLAEQMAQAGPSVVSPEAAFGSSSFDGSLFSTPTFISCIEDFSAYMLDSRVRREILAKFTAVVRPFLEAGTPIDVISHSWGTVVAYEGLRELEDAGLTAPLVQNFFTAGAALSIGPVKLSLRPQNRDGRRPAMVRRWINLNAEGDPVGGDIQGHPFHVDAQFLHLPNLGCGLLDISCKHGSYFKRDNVAVNRDIFARFINQAPAASGAGAVGAPITAARAADSATVAGVGQTQALGAFLAQAGILSTEDRRTIVEQAIAMLEGVYVHLPLKRAMHAIEPIQSLKLMRHYLPELSERAFHDRMIFTFSHLRDLHTNYVLPEPYQNSSAFLPFRVERFWETPQAPSPSYVVTLVAASVTDANFRPGVVVTHWNGIPIHRAVELNGDREAGSNLEARRARGLESLTIRWMGMSLPPEEEWVVVAYHGEDGQAREARFDWRTLPPSDATSGADLISSAAVMLGVAAQTEMEQRVRKVLFAQRTVELERRISAATAAMPVAEAAVSSGSARYAAGAADAVRAAGADPNLTSVLPGVFKEFRPINTPDGSFGYVRIATFNVDDQAFISEFIRIVGLLPQTGLIIDVRGNGGGNILAGERLLQVLTPGPIQPEPFQFINTPLTLEISKLQQFAPWADSIDRSVITGDTMSQGLPLLPLESYNDIGQKYQGPIVLIVDALCYSTTDIFTAGFADHSIGRIIGTDSNTGAGGANVWTHDLLRAFLPGANSPFRALPRHTSMRVAVRRTTRVGQTNGGTVLEELGIAVDAENIHRMTRNDVLNANEDLKTRAVMELRKMDRQSLVANLQRRADGSITGNLSTENIDRVDVFVARRPVVTFNVRDGSNSANILPPQPLPSSVVVECRGFRREQLVAATRVSV